MDTEDRRGRGIADRLIEALGRQVVVDPDVVAAHTNDWTGRFRGRSPAVLRPTTTDEVAAAVDTCRHLGVALVPQGGNTGLVGGGVPLDGEVVLSLRALGRLGEVDDRSGQVTAGAGVTVGRLDGTATGHRWSYGVDLASRDSATVGGTIATNAGGIHMVRYGDTRAQVVGVEAVLGTGAVVSHLAGLVKDNTGYHLPSLLCGSEGTLAVVTAARLRLVPRLACRTTALVAFGSVDAAVDAVGPLRRSLSILESCELFLGTGVDLVCSAFGLRPPFPDLHAAYLLLEAADHADPTGPLGEAVEALPDVADAVVATDAVRRAELWRFREGHTEAINTLGPPHKLDVTVPLGAMAELLARAPAVVRSWAPTARTWLFGHAADGNVHVNVSGLDPDDDRVDGAVFELVAGLGGSISAEHGIGTAKRDFLHLSRTPAEIEAFRALKRALDPDGVLNPQVLLPPA